MTNQQIQQLLATLGSDTHQLVETHISWVILGKDFVYKLKKPLAFGFLDFSTLEQRKYYCNRELILNNRLSQGVYLEVLPVCYDDGEYQIGDQGTVVDYALKMRRLDTNQQMNIRLEEKRVSPANMQALAKELAIFHQSADRITAPVSWEQQYEDFADILSVKNTLSLIEGYDTTTQLKESCQQAQHFLRQHQHRIIERQQLGFLIDGHGDLHSGNIFLLTPPVIFDCIEFNDQLRQLDILNELAFLCMDLHYYQQQHLESPFLLSYRQLFEAFFTEEDWALFQYYKWYRANVRLKVYLLAAQGKEIVSPELKEQVHQRWELFKFFSLSFPK